MTTTDIFEAFLTRLAAFATTNSVAVAYPNVDFNPPGSGLWLEARYFPNEDETTTWGVGECHLSVGFFQVLIFCRTGTGQVNASELADALVDYFPKGQVIHNVTIRKRPSQAPLVTLDDKSYIPLRIYYRGFT